MSKPIDLPKVRRTDAYLRDFKKRHPEELAAALERLTPEELDEMTTTEEPEE